LSEYDDRKVDSRKRKSLLISVLIHGTVLTVIGTATYKLAIPEGEVTTTLSFEIPKGQITEVDIVDEQKQIKEAPKKVQSVASAKKKKKSKSAKKIKEKKVKIVKKTAKKIPKKLPEIKKIEAKEETPEMDPVELAHTVENKADKKPKSDETPEDLKDIENRQDDKDLDEITNTEGDDSINSSAASPADQEGVPGTPPPGIASNLPDKRGLPQGSVRLADRVLSPLPGNRKPSYPVVARLRRLDGVVVLDFIVHPDGHVSKVWVVKSSGHRVLDLEAAQAQKKYRYQPGKVGRFRKAHVFKLKGEAETIR
jgi:TonB family protein